MLARTVWAILVAFAGASSGSEGQRAVHDAVAGAEYVPASSGRALADTKKILLWVAPSNGALPITSATAAINSMAAQRGWAVTTVTAGATFPSLAGYSAFMSLFAGGETIPSGHRADLEAFIDAGNGFVGVQAPYRGSATAWPFYTQLVGVTSKGSPSGLSTATVRVEDPAHPATSFLKRKWSLKQTWENYDMNAYATIDFVNSIRERVHVLATVDESSYNGGTTGRDHPISWCQGFMGGRMFHTGLGGANSMWSDTNFKTHLAEGIAWALFQNGGDCNAGVDRFYRKTQIKTIYNALRMAAAPKGDERIFIAAKNGLVQSYYPSTGIFKTVVQLSVSSSEEQGLLGIALDPQFATTKHVFLYYSPSDTGASGYRNRLSRFKLNGDVLDKASEKIVLKVPEDQVMHSSGAIHFDTWGDLWLSLGDNTDYKLSGGWAPINSSSSKGDARRTSANSNDLRGSILRIRVDSNGGYSCPDGNLFPRGTSNAKCEIYSMGMRNPFSFALHPTVRGVVMWGDCGPDASTTDRGPIGLDEFNIATSPNFFGWPFCVGANSPYVNWDYSAPSGSQNKGYFKCDTNTKITNSSKWNTGSSQVGPPQPATVWYNTQEQTNNPDIIRSTQLRVCAMLPYVHHHDKNNVNNECALPGYYDNAAIMVDFIRGELNHAILDDDGKLMHIVPMWGTLGQFFQPIDMITNSEGVTFVIEWRGDRSTTLGQATLTQVCYTGAVPSVTAACKADKVAGLPPLSVSVTSGGSFHSQGARLAYEWDFGDGSVMELTPDASHTFTAPGNYRVLLTTTAVSDSTMTDQCAIDVSVGNSAPTVVINAPAWDAGFYCSGSKLDFNVDAFDAEDGNTNAGTIGCDQLLVSYYVGHDAHFHPSGAYKSCRGGQTVDMAGHALLADDIYWGIELQYTDKGNAPAKPTTSRTSVLAYNRMIQAEDYTGHSDATCAKYAKLQKDGCSMTAKSEGGLLAQGPKGGGWMKYGPYNPFNLKQVSVRFTAVKSTVTLQLRAHSPTGPILAVWRLPSTASDVSNIIYNDTFKEATTGFADPNQTLTLDLGSTKSVGKIVLAAPARSNCPAGYAIYGKDSSGNYQLPVTPFTRSKTPSCDTAGQTTIAFSGSARYLVIVQTGNSDSAWAVAEARVYAPDGTSIKVNGAKALYNKDAAYKAVDGNTGTNWSTLIKQIGGPFSLYLTPTGTSTWFANWFEFSNGAGVSSSSACTAYANCGKYNQCNNSCGDGSCSSSSESCSTCPADCGICTSSTV